MIYVRVSDDQWTRGRVEVTHGGADVKTSLDAGNIDGVVVQVGIDATTARTCFTKEMIVEAEKIVLVVVDWKHGATSDGKLLKQFFIGDGNADVRLVWHGVDDNTLWKVSKSIK
jgi:hypothetical protein